MPAARLEPLDGGSRVFLRVCVTSAKQTITILEALHSQSLLGESRSPFTYGSFWSNLRAP